MSRELVRPPSARRMFVGYVGVSLVPVLVLAGLLAASLRADAQQRGLRNGEAMAALIAQATVEPLLTGADLRLGLPGATDATLRRLAVKTIADGTIAGLRVRDLDGRVRFADDARGEGRMDGDGDARRATRGGVVTRVIETAGRGDQSVVIRTYRPLKAGPMSQRVGVLEVELPYAPIRARADERLRVLYANLAVGLGLLYLVLAAVSVATTRRLRRQSLDNLYLAEHDQLTGLANRRVFDRHLTRLGGRSATGRRAAVAVLDLDRFREVNDTIGHQGGDEVVAELATRLRSHVGDGDLLARLGPDEFGLVLHAVEDAEQAEQVLRRLQAVVSEPLVVQGMPLSTEASIGFVLWPDDGAGAQLLQRADIAMYNAKAGHAGVLRYDRADDHHDSDRLALVGELRHALTSDELVLHFQPTLRLRDDQVRTVEALVRWHHPRHGLIYPDRFLPVAERTGLIDPLTDWVLATALTQVRTWEHLGVHVDVAVNVSARNLTSQGFADRVLDALAASGLPSRRLVLEVTETAVFADLEKATRELHRLRRAGIRISLDDFGQGSTSLGYLGRLPLTELKIDRQFVTDMATRSGDAAIVRSLIDLAHNLGMSVVAEGVEDERTLATLRHGGCDVAQGYVLARPMGASALIEWFAARAQQDGAPTPVTQPLSVRPG